MEYQIGDTKLKYFTSGEVRSGDDVCLINQADDLTRKTSWTECGYSIEHLFDDQTHQTFYKNTRNLLINLWKKAGLKVANSFNLEDYHTLTTSWELHLAAIEFTKLLPVSLFPIPIHKLEGRVAEIIQDKVIACNPFDNQSIFHFRIIRPNSNDNNPLHRDVWLPDYKDCINLYIPIAGSNENSSLIIAPGSHRWAESNLEKTIAGAVINGIKYNVPAVSKIFNQTEFVRPNPKENEVLIFSPYLIHGGSVNLNSDLTRISIEIRFWRK